MFLSLTCLRKLNQTYSASKMQGAFLLLRQEDLEILASKSEFDSP